MSEHQRRHRCYREEAHDGTPDGCLTDVQLVVLGMLLGYQLGEELRDNPNENGVFQDDWQSDEDIAALDGMVIGGVKKLRKA